MTNVTAPEWLKNCRVGTKRLETIAAEVELDSAKLPAGPSKVLTSDRSRVVFALARLCWCPSLARALRRDLGVARSDRIPSSVTRRINARGECRQDNRGK